MGLQKNPRLFFVGLTQIFARVYRFSETCIQVLREPNASAVGAMSAEVGQAIGNWTLQTIHGARHHERKHVLPRSLGARKDHGMRKVIARNFPTISELPTKSEKGIRQLLASSQNMLWRTQTQARG